jgi:dTDP-4-amino-4,6-dideoxygalactose transaminase
MTFVGCANAIVQSGADPVLVDSEPETGLIDLEHAASLAGPRTRALMPVHLGGHPLDMERVAQLRDRLGVLVIEDAAHAVGARWGWRAIGDHGNPTAFSFHASKNITTFEAVPWWSRTLIRPLASSDSRCRDSPARPGLGMGTRLLRNTTSRNPASSSR